LSYRGKKISRQPASPGCRFWQSELQEARFFAEPKRLVKGFFRKQMLHLPQHEYALASAEVLLC